jgi:hypothetical protein
MIKIFRRVQNERVLNPLKNDFFNDLEHEETLSCTLVFHGLVLGKMEKVITNIVITMIIKYS